MELMNYTHFVNNKESKASMTMYSDPCFIRPLLWETTQKYPKWLFCIIMNLSYKTIYLPYKTNLVLCGLGYYRDHCTWTFLVFGLNIFYFKIIWIANKHKAYEWLSSWKMYLIQYYIEQPDKFVLIRGTGYESWGLWTNVKLNIATRYKRCSQRKRGAWMGG